MTPIDDHCFIIYTKSMEYSGCVVTDNSTLSLFVDAEVEILLFRCFGPILGVPSVIHPDPGNWQAEFNRVIHQKPGTPKAHRRGRYLAQAGHLWTPVDLTAAELKQAEEYTEQYPKLAGYRKGGRRADLEVLAVARVRGCLLLTDDQGLRKAAQAEGVGTMGSCGILKTAVDAGEIRCQRAECLYNRVFKERLGLWSGVVLECHQGGARCK
jgi:hypothetical protein